MILGAVGDTPYNIVLLIHILAMFVAFAPAFVQPFIEIDTKGDSTRAKLFEGIAKRSMRIHGGALVLGGFLGFGLAGMSKDVNDELVYAVKDGWITAAVVVWVAMNGVLHGLIVPAEKAVAAGDESRTSKLALGGQLIHALFLVSLYLMVFKPGA